MAADVNTFRSCFGLGGTALAMHGATNLQPILESSLDAMVVSMVAPALTGFDLWVHPLDEEADDGDVEGFLEMLAQPVQAAANGAPLPNVISVSYGECEASVKPYTASRTLVERQLAATAALGITTVVAAGDTAPRRVRAGCLRARPPTPRSSRPRRGRPPRRGPRGRRDEPDADDSEHDREHRPVERHDVPGARQPDRGRRRRREHVRPAPLVAACAAVPEDLPDGARRRRVRGREPRLRDRVLVRRAELRPVRAGRRSATSAGPARRRRSWRA